MHYVSDTRPRAFTHITSYHPCLGRVIISCFIEAWKSQTILQRGMKELLGVKAIFYILTGLVDMQVYTFERIYLQSSTI